MSVPKQRTKNSLRCWEGQLLFKAEFFHVTYVVFVIPCKPRTEENQPLRPSAANRGPWHGNTGDGREAGNHVLPRMQGCMCQERPSGRPTPGPALGLSFKSPYLMFCPKHPFSVMDRQVNRDREFPLREREPASVCNNWSWRIRNLLIELSQRRWLSACASTGQVTTCLWESWAVGSTYELASSCWTLTRCLILC